MNTDENKISGAQEPSGTGASSADEDINAFLDSVSGSSADDFLEKLYQDSFADLTSDFDSLLQEFQSIDPDDPTGGAQTQPAQQMKQQTEQKPEMEDVYSYSDHAQALSDERSSFSDAVQQAIDAEEAAAQANRADDTFHVSLDRLDGGDQGLGSAVESAQEPQDGGSTRVFSPMADASEAALSRAQQPTRGVQERHDAPKKAKRKNSLLPQKNDSVFEIFRKVLFLVSLVVVIVCLVLIGNIYLLQPTLEKRRQARIGELMNESVSDAASFEQVYSGQEIPSGARYNLAQFYAANPDFYGYLEIKGTGISTPVVQGKDNNKYLRRNFFGETTKYGCPFVNFKNTYAALDYNTSIFGHNMEYDDLVFGELESYRKIDGFKKAPLIHLETMYADYSFKIYAVFLTDADADSTGWYFNYIFTQLKDEAECAEYIAQLDQRKLYSTGVDIKPTDKLLTLSTCTYDFDNERLVVVGRLVRDGESEDVDTSKAVANNNPRYPDRYYQKKGLTNPYSNAEKWIPNK